MSTPSPAVAVRLETARALVRSTWHWYNEHRKNLLGIGLITFGPVFFLQLLWQIFLYKLALSGLDLNASLRTGQQRESHMFFDFVLVKHPALSTILLIAILLAVVVWETWGEVAFYSYIITRDKTLRPWQAFQKSRQHLWRFLGVGLILTLVLLGGLFLLVFPGIYWGVLFGLVPLLVISENRKLDAFRRSRELIRGYWWPVFGRGLLLWLSMLGVAILAALGFGLTVGVLTAIYRPIGLVVQPMSNFLGSLIFTPIIAIFSYSLYQNLKKVKGF